MNSFFLISIGYMIGVIFSIVAKMIIDGRLKKKLEVVKVGEQFGIRRIRYDDYEYLVLSKSYPDWRSTYFEDRFGTIEEVNKALKMLEIFNSPEVVKSYKTK